MNFVRRAAITPTVAGRALAEGTRFQPPSAALSIGKGVERRLVRRLKPRVIMTRRLRPFALTGEEQRAVSRTTTIQPPMWGKPERSGIARY